MISRYNHYTKSDSAGFHECGNEYFSSRKTIEDYPEIVKPISHPPNRPFENREQ
jgi:hypothetical protein